LAEAIRIVTQLFNAVVHKKLHHTEKLSLCISVVSMEKLSRPKKSGDATRREVNVMTSLPFALTHSFNADPAATSLERKTRHLAGQDAGAGSVAELIRRTRDLANKNSALVERIKIQAISAEQKLGIAARLTPSALQNAPVGIVVCNSRARITRANLAARQLADVELRGYSLHRAPIIFGEMYDTQAARVPAKSWPWMRALRGERIEMECRLVRARGKSSNVLFSSAPITEAAGRLSGAVTTIVDITHHREDDVAQRDRAVEDERNRIAANIHDTVAQDITAVLLSLAAVEQNIPESSYEARQHLRLAAEMAQKALAEARQSIWSLGQESLKHEDLAVALPFLAQQTVGDAPLNLVLQVPRQANGLSSGIRRELLRIAHEAIVNVLKHARATELRVTLNLHLNQAELRVEDNGHGFTAGPLPKSGSGFGLLSMRARAERLGGCFTVTSRLTRGTCLVASLPIVAAAA
jgi:signal transduction histidine kinase